MRVRSAGAGVTVERTNRRFRRIALHLGVLLMLPACAEVESEVAQVDYRTLPNGAVVVSNTLPGNRPILDRISLIHEATTGWAEGDGPHMFGQIFDIETDDYGRLYVLDGLAQEVRVFSSTGDFVRTIGEAGEGPGRLVNGVGLAWHDDELWVFDLGGNKFEVFDSTGVHRRSVRRLHVGGAQPWIGRFEDTGRLYDQAFAVQGEEYHSILIRYSPLEPGLPIDTFPLPQYQGDFVQLPAHGGAYAWVPYSPRLVLDLGPDEDLWFVRTDDYRITNRLLSGDTVRLVERSAEPVAVTAEERDKAIAEIRELGGDISRDRIPETKPLIKGIRADAEGHLWVLLEQEDDHSGATVDIFDIEGVYRGSVATTFKLEFWPPPIVRNGRLYAVAKNDLDAEAVVRFKIQGL